MRPLALKLGFPSALALGGDVPRSRLAEPDYLPPLARQILRSRMQRHGDDMMHLVMAVCHHPPFSNGDHGDIEACRRATAALAYNYVCALMELQSLRAPGGLLAA